MSSKPCDESGSACGRIGTERNRYFTGKYMAARDFAVEQDYFLTHHRLHNRVLHGWGVVCGLRVVAHPDPECRKRWVVVKSGIAVDCCGREVVLFKDKGIELPLPEHHHGGGQQQSAAGSTPNLAQMQTQTGPGQHPHHPQPPPEHPVEREFLVCIRYTEQKIEKVPALYNDGACDPGKEDYNRVRECTELVVLDPSDVPECWRRAVPIDPANHCCDDCDDPIPGPAGICLEPKCPCKDTVPLALVQWVPRDHDRPLHIHMDGRRTLPTPPEFLTHIVGINWPHGGTISLTHLREHMHGRLEIYFDRKIKPAHEMASGINEFTFVVQYGDIQREVEFLPTKPGARPSLDGNCKAVYHVEPSILVDDGRGLTLSNHVLFVTLYCDFILDCHDNAVDGNFLGAKFPTGNGQRGSTFRSWFRVRER